ncbi:hypothetical protein G7Z17_g4083 [Cylindrodendrum hubeiense]|uniref:Transcription activator GCR1-like domain-containing protein n=1 Tax=Cylindrodendrum hubeiense TaxID=595255 RepID=A0A9P5HFK4_9HYPO|nr:hypothetical protein G7Z17_g4083 [Cylindrodendrum hubeiense]
MRQPPEAMAKAALAMLPTMLPTPQQSPEPYPDLVGPVPARGPPHHSIRTATPGARNGQQKFSRGDVSQQHEFPDNQVAFHERRQSQTDEDVNNVPISLARVVVNMHGHYSSELEGEKQRSQALQKQCNKMQQKLEHVERRMQSHVVLLDGFVDFMEQVKRGDFAVGGKAIDPELAIARRLGAEHLEAVQSLLSFNQRPVTKATCHDVVPETEQEVDGDDDDDDDDDDDVPETTQFPDDGNDDSDTQEYSQRLDDGCRDEDIPETTQFPDDDDNDHDNLPGNTQLENRDTTLAPVQDLNSENSQPRTPGILVLRDSIDAPLPTPDLYTAPLRSTGTRAAKRKSPPSLTKSKIKRRVGMSPEAIYEMKLGQTLQDLEYCDLEQQLKFRTLDHSESGGSNSEGSLAYSGAPPDRPLTRMHTRWRAVNGSPPRPKSPADAISVDGNDGSDYEPGSDDEDYEDDEGDTDEDEPSSLKPSRSARRTSIKAHPATAKPSTAPTKTTPAPTKVSSVPAKLCPAPVTVSPAPIPRAPLPPPKQPAGKPRYSMPRSIGDRYAPGPPGGKPYKFIGRPKSAAVMWEEWKHGLHGEPSLESLERRWSTSWRNGTVQELKYGSNYVSKRLKVVKKVEQMCEDQGISPEEACKMLDQRVDGRMELLQKALTDGKDPFIVIPPR